MVHSRDPQTHSYPRMVHFGTLFWTLPDRLGEVLELSEAIWVVRM
jgi:hypothetical protein